MRRLSPALLPLAALALVAACSTPPQGRTPYTPTPAMTKVLEERQNMHPHELSDLSAADAREVPGLIAAAQAIPNVDGLPATFTDVPQVQQLVASGAEGPLTARLYRPALARNTPVILYFVGGTWVTGTLDTYEETARQLAIRTGWVVVSLRTRLAPRRVSPPSTTTPSRCINGPAPICANGVPTPPAWSWPGGARRQPGTQHRVAGARRLAVGPPGGHAGPASADHPRRRHRARHAEQCARTGAAGR